MPDAEPASNPISRLALGGWRERVRRPLLIAGPALVVIVALFLYLTGGRYTSTDDAYIQAARVDISTDVSGRIAKIEVHDNERVTAGQVLFRLEQPRFLIAVAEADAKLAQARLQISALQAAYRQRQAGEEAARTMLAFRQREFDRQTKLQAQGISSRAQLDEAKSSFEAAQQQLAAAAQQTASALAELGGDPDAPVDSRPMVRQAQAALDHANLELSYTVVRAPSDGIVAKVDGIQVGDHVDASTPLFALMSSEKIWVEANFKETQLTHMRPGQNVTFTIDAFPGKRFTGKVLSTSPGTGSSFALLPPENASGNWVKVVQRLPVRLSIDTDKIDVPLATGMSVIVKVDTGHSRIGSLWN